MNTMDYATRFLGGRGIATRMYWEKVGPQVRAFDPENHLIFMTGPLGATGVQGASRSVVVGKSPMLMPEGFCYGNLGGSFAPALKNAGYDGLVIRGYSDRPSYLWIQDDSVRIQDASGLWGKGTYAVRDMLRQGHGTNVRLLTTGAPVPVSCPCLHEHRLPSVSVLSSHDRRRYEAPHKSICKSPLICGAALPIGVEYGDR